MSHITRALFYKVISDEKKLLYKRKLYQRVRMTFKRLLFSTSPIITFKRKSNKGIHNTLKIIN